MAQYEASWGEGPWATWKPFRIFFEFLPKQKGFKRSERYEGIAEKLKRPDIEAYLAFMLFVSQDFERLFAIFPVWSANDSHALG